MPHIQARRANCACVRFKTRASRALLQVAEKVTSTETTFFFGPSLPDYCCCGCPNYIGLHIYTYNIYTYFWLKKKSKEKKRESKMPVH